MTQTHPCWRCDDPIPWYYTGQLCGACRASDLVARMAVDHLHQEQRWVKAKKGGIARKVALAVRAYKRRKAQVAA